MPEIRLSAAVIAKNEEEKIGRCIDSLSFADEIIVVDSGSQDRTVEIARSRGAQVVFHEWEGHIQQKNFAIDQTRGEWVLSLDADEIVSPELREEILKAINDPAVDGYAIPRLVYYINRWIFHSGWYPARKVRLFRRGKGRWGGENPHDRITLEGREGTLKGDMYHLSFDDISDHLKTINSFTDIAAEERAAKSDKSSWLAIVTRPPATFLKMYLLKLGFLDGVPGFIVASLSAYHVFCKYVKIWEKRLG